MNKSRFVCLLYLLLLQHSVKASWQQAVDYKFELELLDSSKQVLVTELLQYQNNSPDTLTSLYFHLWPNAYKSLSTPLAKQLLKNGDLAWRFAEDKARGGIDSLLIFSEGKSLKWVFQQGFGEEVLKLDLPSPLLPNNAVDLAMVFTLTVPQTDVSRLGYDDGIFTVSQWYPKPVVYNEEGWQMMPYLDQGEFFSEFGDYEVKITVPEAYMVATSGKLVGGDLKQENAAILALNNYTKLFLDTMNSKSLWKNRTVKKGKKSLVYSLKRAHDFAWLTSKRWMCLTDTIYIDGKQLPLVSYFTRSNAELWKEANHYLKRSLSFYGERLGSYPYGSYSLVDVGNNVEGGMEYPGMSVIGTMSNGFLLEQVIAHEVGHNWWYGILASNERQSPWMDEGLNSYYELKYMLKFHEGEDLSKMFGPNMKKVNNAQKLPSFRMYYWYSYLYMLSRGIDQSSYLPATAFEYFDYGALVYAKTAHLLYFYDSYLGDGKLEKRLQKYYEKWAFKHPTENDLLTAIGVDKDGAWFKELMSGTGKMDYAVLDYDPQSCKLLVQNKGDVLAPIPIDLMRSDTVYKRIWLEGFQGKVVVEIPDSSFDRIEIDHDQISADLNKSNNVYSPLKAFPKFEKTKLKLIGAFPLQGENQIFCLPFIGYNALDFLQFGGVFYNSLLEKKNLRFLLMPKYGMLSGRLGGDYHLYYSNFSKKWGHRFSVSLNYRNITLPKFETFGRGQKASLEINLKNKKEFWRSTISVQYLARRFAYSNQEALENQYLIFKGNLKNTSTLAPAKFNFRYEWIDFYANKLSLSYRQELFFHPEWSSVKLRLFGGVFLGAPNDLVHRFRLSAGSGNDAIIQSGGELISRGLNDYLMEDQFFSRYGSSGSVISQQIYQKDGGFRTGLFVGDNNEWMLSANVTLPTPSKYLSLFLDIGAYPAWSDVPYSAGFQFNLIEDVIELYFPLLWSKSIESNSQAQGLDKYYNKVRFMINLGQFQDLLK